MNTKLDFSKVLKEPPDISTEINGLEWTGGAVITAALIRRLGGKVTLSANELLPPKGMTYTRTESDGIILETDDKYRPCDQIIYMPPHAGRDKEHPDCEKGFIMDLTEDLGVFLCRFFDKDGRSISTTSCSELVLVNDIVLHKHHPQLEIDELYNKINTERTEQTKQKEYYSKIIELVKTHGLGFLHNPGGGEFNCREWGRCQVPFMCNKEDYEILQRWVTSKIKGE